MENNKQLAEAEALIRSKEPEIKQVVGNVRGIAEDVLQIISKRKVSWLVASMGLCDAWQRLNGLGFEQGLVTYKKARGFDQNLFESILKKIDENEEANPEKQFAEKGDIQVPIAPTERERLEKEGLI